MHTCICICTYAYMYIHVLYMRRHVSTCMCAFTQVNTCAWTTREGSWVPRLSFHMQVFLEPWAHKYTHVCFPDVKQPRHWRCSLEIHTLCHESMLIIKISEASPRKNYMDHENVHKYLGESVTWKSSTQGSEALLWTPCHFDSLIAFMVSFCVEYNEASEHL